MKSPSLPLALLVLIFFGIKPLFAKEINTPFGSIPDKFQYSESGEDMDQHIVTITQEANGENEQQIRVSVDGNTPVTVSSEVVQYLTNLKMDNQTKINIFIALIISQQYEAGYNLLANVNADDTDGKKAQSEEMFSGGRYVFNIASRNPENDYPLTIDVPTDSNLMTNSWHFRIINPRPRQFTISMVPEPAPDPEPASDDEECTQEESNSACCSGLLALCKRRFADY